MLPSLRHALELQVNERSAELAIYGDYADGASTAAQGPMLLRLVSDYADSFGQMVNGNYQSLPTNSIAGGARVRYIFKVRRGGEGGSLPLLESPSARPIVPLLINITFSELPINLLIS
jgi:hypothetical protein